MARFRRSPMLLALVVLALAAGVVVGISAGASTPTLPATTPGRLVASTLKALSANRPVSGQLLAHVDLGLPPLPEVAPRAAPGLASLVDAISGDHRVRVWHSRDGARVSELLPAAELSLFVSRTARQADAWTWDSRSFTAVHLGPVAAPAESSPAQLLDPVRAAQQLLQAVSPTTTVALSPPARVAGRDAYVLRIEPRTSGTLIGHIDIAIDATERLPLRVAVFARGASAPALSLGFTSINFGAIDPSVYRFSPPKGATVQRVRPSAAGAADANGSSAPEMGASGTAEQFGEYVRTFGHDWTTVIAYRIPRPAATGNGEIELRSLLPFNGRLFSATLAERGDHAWLLIGAVPQSSLAAVEPKLA